jgi:hypothetical protein
MDQRTVRAIASSGLTIYDSLQDRRDLYLEDETLQTLLARSLRGVDLNYPIRTRSKVLKAKICEALGYPVPKTFQRTRPRFPGQNFDVYAQKAHNLQVWNQEIAASRRYVVVEVGTDGRAERVRVVRGEVLAKYDATGTLTSKYQAKSRAAVRQSVLASPRDTLNVRRRVIRSRSPLLPGFLPIRQLFDRLLPMVGSKIPNPGRDQERNRGWALHQAVCGELAKIVPADCGKFPDVPDQLLELKLQTAATIDLGLVSPDSTAPIAGLPALQHSDVRYAVFYGALTGSEVRLDYLVLVTGADFFTFFQRFEGRIVNKKLQLHLPAGFFD